MDLTTFITKALSVPFEIGGRGFEGWDCWGLVHVAYRELFGLTIASYADRYNGVLSYREVAELIGAEKPFWQAIAEPQFGDVGLYRAGRHETHVALILPHRRMLHCEERVGTINERLDNVIWGGRNVGYYRHSARA